jgi:DNA polymerase III epsilon subunit-like protein
MNKYVSIDIETTGVDPENNQILEIGAIIEDVNNLFSFDEIPKFKRILRHPIYSGAAFAINMNQRIFKELAKERSDEKITYPGLVVQEFADFLLANGFDVPENEKRIKIVAAGKNFSSFDRMFLQKLPNWKAKITTGHRTLDPGMMYLDFKKDANTPSLKLCKERAGVAGEVTHNALEDAWDVIQVLRPFYSN